MTTTSFCSEHPSKLAPFNPTCSQAQEIALSLFELTPDDVLFDLGCGDGRFLLSALANGFQGRCIGIEFDSVFVERARKSIKDAFDSNTVDLADASENHVTRQQQSQQQAANRVEIRWGDVLDESVRGVEFREDATAVFVYLLPKGLARIRPILEDLRTQRRHQHKPFRVVSYMFAIPGWQPNTVDRRTKGECPVYLYCD